jgi:UDP-glucose 4-epimerase
MRVIVTGAAGYIGGETALKLKDSGHTVIGIDRRPCPAHLSCFDHYVREDFAKEEVLKFIADADADAIVHCAGTSLVGPSVTDPQEYYHNNMANTLRLLDTIIQHTPTTRIIFSSSAAVYGTPIMVPCSEVDPCEPISPYGETKLAIEWMMRGYNKAYNLDYVAFRYFNAAGADSQGRHGQDPGATHIIARVLESIRNKAVFVLHGNNYETADGTCIRDYVHVEDIADAHMLALDKAVPAGVYNIGTNKGISNLEIINRSATVTGVSVAVQIESRREGDPSMLTAESTKFQAVTAWQPKYSLHDIIQHAWNWYNR